MKADNLIEVINDYEIAAQKSSERKEESEKEKEESNEEYESAKEKGEQSFLLNTLKQILSHSKQNYESLVKLLEIYLNVLLL